MKIQIIIDLNDDITPQEATMLMREMITEVISEYQDCYEKADAQILSEKGGEE